MQQKTQPTGVPQAQSLLRRLQVPVAAMLIAVTPAVAGNEGSSLSDRKASAGAANASDMYVKGLTDYKTIIEKHLATNDKIGEEDRKAGNAAVEILKKAIVNPDTVTADEISQVSNKAIRLKLAELVITNRPSATAIADKPGSSATVVKPLGRQQAVAQELSLVKYDQLLPDSQLFTPANGEDLKKIKKGVTNSVTMKGSSRIGISLQAKFEIDEKNPDRREFKGFVFNDANGAVNPELTKAMTTEFKQYLTKLTKAINDHLRDKDGVKKINEAKKKEDWKYPGNYLLEDLAVVFETIQKGETTINVLLGDERLWIVAKLPDGKHPNDLIAVVAGKPKSEVTSATAPSK